MKSSLAMRRLAMLIISLVSKVPVHGQSAGSLDFGFNPNVYNDVLGIAVQADGKILIGGIFLNIGDLPRNRIARLNSDGSVESTATFNTGSGANGEVWNVIVQNDGKILLGGGFSTINGQPRNSIARLQANGSLEDTSTFNPGTGTNGRIYVMAIQPDAKILIGGVFSAVSGQPRNNIARLNPDGTVESINTFRADADSLGAVSALAVQADGKIVIGGTFTSVNGQPRNRIARLNANGSLESTVTFNAGSGSNDTVTCVAVQGDGKILIGGNFTNVGGQARKNLARLNVNGTVESLASFQLGTGPDNEVQCFTLHSDGKIVITGLFANVNSQPRNWLARLSADGGLESQTTFAAGTGADGRIDSIAVQQDGGILVGGIFTHFNGVARQRLARLSSDAVTEALTVPDNTRLKWIRTGPAPEVEQVTFELSTNGGTSWILLGNGARIAGGWECTALSLPANGAIRFRGRMISGLYCGSSGVVERVSILPPPFQQWTLNHLGDANASAFGDPDRDGLPTLVEYALSTLPEAPNALPFAVSRFNYDDGERLRMILSRDPTHDDVTIEVQSAGSVGGLWTTVARSAIGVPFSGPGYVGGDSATPGMKSVEVRDTVNIAGVTQRFLRVKVTR